MRIKLYATSKVRAFVAPTGPDASGYRRLVIGPALTFLLSLTALVLLALPQRSFGIVYLGSGLLNDSADRGCHVTPGGPGSLPGETTGQGNRAQCVTCQSNGMPVWSVSSPYCNVWLSDQPISYSVSSGQTMAFRWLYEQREHPIGDLGLREWNVGASPVPTRLRGTLVTSAPYNFTMTNAAWCHNWWSEIVFWDTNFENVATINTQPTPDQPMPNTTRQYWSFSGTFEGIVQFGEGGSLYFNLGSLNSHNGSSKLQIQMLGEVSTNGGPEVPVDHFVNGSTIYTYPLYTNGVSWISNPQYGFRLLYPDGSQDIYGFVRLTGDRLTCPYQGDDPRCYTTNYNNNQPKDYTSRAYLTERIDPQGRSIHLIYTKQTQLDQWGNANGTFFPLTYLVDTDGRTNTYYYNPHNFWQLKYIVDAYGRTNSLTYDSNGMLASLTDGAGLTSSFQYQPRIMTVTTNYGGGGINYQITTSYAGWLTNLITPYGGTRFDYFDETTNAAYGVTRRAVLVTETNGAHQFYAYIHNAGNKLTNFASAAEIPSVPFGGYTFDTGNVAEPGGGLNLRNSISWGERQFTALSTNVSNALAITQFLHPQPDLTTALNSLTANDLQVGQLQHWLVDSDGATTTEYLSSEREPCFDAQGQVPGPRTWFDYAGKQSGAPYQVGTQTLIGCVAQVLPDGSSQFVGLDYALSGLPTNRWESYTTTAWTNGVRTNSYVYNVNGVDPVSMTGPAGESLHLAYNATHQVNFITNALNQVTTLNWDLNTFNLRSVALPSGQAVGFNYYPPNHPGSAPTSTGALVSNITFSAEGLIVAIADYTNGLPRVVHSTATGLLDLWFTNSWDGLNRLTKTAFTDGTSISNTYTNLDLSGHKDRLGYWTYFGYDALRHPLWIADARNNTNYLEWCGCGALVSITDPLNKMTVFNYNNEGLLTNILFPDTSQITYAFDSIGRVTRVTDGANRSITSSYNNQGLTTTISNAFGPLVRVAYDTLDRPVQVTDANGLTLTNQFDLLNQLTNRTWQDGFGEAFVYAVNGLIAYTNRDGKPTLFSRDSAGRLVGITNANQETTAFKYNALDEVTDLCDGRTNHTTWQYNQYGWLMAKTNALRGVFVYTRDPNGQVTNRWTPQFGNTAYAFDPVGNLTNIVYSGSPSTHSVALVYDALNRLQTVVDGSGTNAFTYTATGQLQTEDGPWPSDTVTNTYLQQSRQTLALAQPSGTPWTQIYGYDSAWRLTSLSSPAGIFGYGYPAGAAALVQTIALPNGASETNHYDSLSRLDFTALLDHWGHILDGYGYTHDPLGLRTNISRYLGMTTNNVAVGYDNIGQITSWSATESDGATRQNEQFAWAYDKSGNLQTRTSGGLVQTFANDTANELTGISRTGPFTVSGATPAPATNITVNGQTAAIYGDMTFAATGLSLGNGANSFTNIAKNMYGASATNLTTVNLPSVILLAFDLNGNLTNDGTRTFVYDAENQLTNVFVSGAWKSEFVYDGLGRRRIERDYGSSGEGWGAPTNELHFIYDGLLLIQVRDATNKVLVTYTRGLDLSGTVDGAGGIGGLLARTDGNGSTYYHANGSANITALIDNYQLIQARYEYSPFGRLVAMLGALGPTNEMGYSSMWNRGPSGLVHFLGRDYDTVTTRWLNPDPVGEIGGINLYQFVRNNPVGLVDPLGLQNQSSVQTPLGAKMVADIESGAFASEGVAADLAKQATARAVQKAFEEAAAAEAKRQAAIALGLAAGTAVIALPNGDSYMPPLPKPGGGKGPPLKPPSTARSCPPFGPGDNEGAARGREAHRWWQPPPGFQKNFKFNSGDIADAINLKTHEILELKTSAAEVQKGADQIAGYIKAAQEQFGGQWTGKVIDPSGQPW